MSVFACARTRPPWSISATRRSRWGGCPADLKANGGEGSIAEQLASSSVQVILGGRKHFKPEAEGERVTVAELATQQGFQVVTSREELLQATPTGRLLGLFSADTMPVRLQGEHGREAEAPEPSALNHLHRFLGDVTLPAPMRCVPNPAAAEVPSLQQMTEATLARLSRDNDRGFFLMIESASIDKQSHERKPCGSIGKWNSSMKRWPAPWPRRQACQHAHPGDRRPRPGGATGAGRKPVCRISIPIYSPGKIARIVTPRAA